MHELDPQTDETLFGFLCAVRRWLSDRGPADVRETPAEMCLQRNDGGGEGDSSDEGVEAEMICGSIPWLW